WTFVLCLALTIIPAVAFGQAASSDSDTQASTATPVAYVYVAATLPDGKTNQVAAYSAASNGSLTAVPGSPFPENVYTMAVNGKYLMGADRAKPDVNAYHIADDGSLSFAATTDYAVFNGHGDDCGGAGEVFFDHTGASLYVQEFNGSDACTNTVVASFSVVKATGGLSYIGTDVTGAFPGLNSAAYFIGNNVYAYAAVYSSCMYYDVYPF